MNFAIFFDSNISVYMISIICFIIFFITFFYVNIVLNIYSFEVKIINNFYIKNCYKKDNKTKNTNHNKNPNNKIVNKKQQSQIEKQDSILELL